MEEEYILKYTGEETDALLKHTESLKDQTTAEDGETVQVYDESGIPHKMAKTELLNKAILATTSIQDISKFIAINEAGNAVGIMTLEQITEVFRKEFAKFPSSSETSAVVAVNKEGDALELMSNEKLAQVVGGLSEVSMVGEYGSIRDFNECSKTGYYPISGGGSATNNPGIGYGGLITINRKIITGYSLQLAFDMFNKKIAYRMTQNGGNWSDWYIFT